MNPDRLKPLISTAIPYLQIGIILLFGIISYANSLDVPLQLDDRTTISKYYSDLFNLQSFTHNTRWFADLSFAINRAMHGEQLLGYHLINLTIHLASASFTYLLVHQAVKGLKQTFFISCSDKYYSLTQHFIPFVTAALFVCHPVQTQAVTYISQRYTSLATLLYIFSLLSYLNARLALANETNKLKSSLWGFASILTALLAMKSKEITFTLPLMIVLFEITLFRGQMLKKRVFLLCCAGLFLIIPLQLFFSLGAVSPEDLPYQIQQATSETNNISRSDYLLTQFRVVATYLRLLILPTNQNLEYDYPLYRSIINPEVFAALMLHVVLVGIALALFMRSKQYLSSCNQSPGISMRLASLGILWFYLALSVESSVIPIYDVIFEHRIYLPSVGFFMAVAAVISIIAARWLRYRNAILIFIFLLCSVLTTSTIVRNRIWSDELLMWQDVLKKSPNKARVKYNVGFLYFKRYMPEKALPYIVGAIEIDSTQEKYWDILNVAITLLGKYEGRYLAVNKYHLVEPEMKKAWLANSFNNLGLANEHLGNLNQARDNYLKAIKLDPSLDIAKYNLTLLK